MAESEESAQCGFLLCMCAELLAVLVIVDEYGSGAPCEKKSQHECDMRS